MLVLQTNCGALAKPLQAVAGVVEKKGINPAVSDIVLISFADGRSEFTGSDTEIEIRSSGPDSETDRPLSFTVNHKRLLDTIRSYSESDACSLDYNPDEGVARLRAGKGVFDFRTGSAEDFPLMRVEDARVATSFSIKRNVFRNLLSQVQYAVAPNEVRFYFTGVCMEILGNELTLVATDSCRLCMASAEMDSVSLGETVDLGDRRRYRKQYDEQMLLSRKTVTELLKALDPSDESPLEVELLTNSMARFRIDGHVMLSKLLKAEFPNFKSVLPPEVTESFDASREKLVSAIHRAANFVADAQKKLVRLEVSPGIVKVIGVNEQNEMAEDGIDVAYQGRSFTFNFQANYLREILVNAQSCDDVRLEFFLQGDDARAKLSVRQPQMPSFMGIVTPYFAS